MKFNEEFIDRVRESSDLVEIVSQYVTLKRSGSGYQGLCPFHGEKTPSFSVSDVKQVYHCFGCKASGNVFKFVQDYMGLTFPEAVEHLAQRAGLPLPESESSWVGSGSEKQEQKKLLYRINAFASEFYHQRLLKLDKQHEVWKYLEGRGLTREDVESYKLGWASNQWSDLSEALGRKKAPLDLTEKVGLIKRRSQSSGHYDLFRSRLMFPIFSPTEKCLGFGGRVIGDDHPKYLNSPDSEVFHKGQVFYGLNLSAKHIRSRDLVLVVEGYMDWIALAKAGLSHAVATLGTALTDRHARLIHRYTSNVVVLFDGDEAGQAAAERSLPILLKEGLFVKGLFLPAKMDPDDFIKAHGAEALEGLVERAPDLFNLLLEQELRKSGTSPSDKTKVIEKMSSILNAVEKDSLKELYVESLAYALNVDKSLIPVQRSERSGTASRPASGAERRRTAGSPFSHAPMASQLGSHVDSNASPPTNPHANSRPGSVIVVEKPSRVEVELLNVSLLKSVYLEEVLSSEILEKLESQGIKKVFRELERLYRQSPDRFDSLASLLSSKVEPGELVTLHLTGPFQSLTDEAAGKLIQDCIKRIHERFLRTQSRALLNNLKGSQGLEQQKKLEQLMNIQRNRQEIKESKEKNNWGENPHIREPNANE